MAKRGYASDSCFCDGGLTFGGDCDQRLHGQTRIFASIISRLCVLLRDVVVVNAQGGVVSIACKRSRLWWARNERIHTAKEIYDETRGGESMAHISKKPTLAFEILHTMLLSQRSTDIKFDTDCKNTLFKKVCPFSYSHSC